MDSLNIIHTLWIGDSLSSMENLMLKSFLCNNYNVYLWTYKNILNIPIGISIKDANEIIPENKIFSYKSQWTWQGKFIRIFRYI